MTLTAATALLLTTIVSQPAIEAAQPAVPDVSGSWAWNESVIFVGPGDIIAFFFGVQVEGPVMHMQCQTWGALTIQQNGDAFTGAADQQWACVSQGGQVALSAPFPATFDVSGAITGHAVHFVADFGQGFTCSYGGSMTVVNGMATSLNATGGCDVPLPIHPNMDKSISFDATRQ
jgi:hypothetical protein